MTPEEFKEKFKVGDIINRESWWDENKLTITAIGQHQFIGIGKAGTESLYAMSDCIFGHWVKVESEKKPSEEINEKVSEELNYAPELRNFTRELITESKCKHILQWLDENWPKVVKK